tara:strand:- start:750 stop:1613 length:864 start_codon:yes stop_codon:yes gene_type:complete
MSFNQFCSALKNPEPFSDEYMAEKKILLKQASASILEDKNLKTSLKCLRDDLCLSKEEIIKAYIDYDLDISKNSNETYQSLALRYVLHMHNLLSGSWHIERQKTALSFIKKLKPRRIADMGFGVPSSYMKYLVQGDFPSHLTLCDIDDSAETFAKSLFNIWAPEKWQKNVTFKKFDMNTGMIVPNQDLYVFQSSIEHVKECTLYLKKHISHSPDHAYFLLSLPIGDITPEHYMEWKTTKEAEQWLYSCGLTLIESKLIHVNPKVDLFADYHQYQYADFYTLCCKNGV